MKYLQIFQDKYELLGRLDDESRGQLLMAMITYQETGEDPQIGGPAFYVWPVFRDMIDQTRESYEQKASAGGKGGAAKGSKAKAYGKTAKAENKQEEAEAKQTEADSKQEEAEAKQTEADSKQSEAKAKQSEAKASIIQESRNKKQESIYSSSSSAPPSSEEDPYDGYDDPEGYLHNHGVSGMVLDRILYSGLVKTMPEAKRTKELADLYGLEMISKAFEKAIDNHAKLFTYVERCCRNGIIEAAEGKTKQVLEQQYHQREITEEIDTADRLVEAWEREQTGTA